MARGTKREARRTLIALNPNCFFCGGLLSLDQSGCKRVEVSGIINRVVFCFDCQHKFQDVLWPQGRRRWHPRTVRYQMWRNNPHCHYCNVKLDFDKSTLDHKIPKSKCGTDFDDNLVLSCEECNLIKGSMPYSNFVEMMKLIQS